MKAKFLSILIAASMAFVAGCVSQAERAYQVEVNRHFTDADVKIAMVKRAKVHFPGVFAVMRAAFDSGQKIVTPKLVKTVHPDFPKAKLKSRSQGGVWIAFTLDKDGSVSDLRPLTEEGAPQDPEFVDAAARAVRQWKFSPATADGKPIPFLLCVPVLFQMGWRSNKALN